MKRPKDHNAKNHKSVSSELTISLLRLALAGALITSVIVAPGLGYVYQQYKKADKRKREQIRKKMHALTRAGYLSRSQAGFALTDKGKRVLNEYEVWQLIPKPPKKWDGKWHMILFDIPGKKERGRQALRARLEELGYEHYQNSVYVHKHNLRSVVEPFANFYDILPHLRFIVATELS